MSAGSSGASVREVARLFAGSRLTLARQLAGLRKVELAKLIEKTPTAIAAYETGRSRPAPAAVAELCVALGVEPGFFLAGPATAQGVNVDPHFRSLRSTSQLARDQAAAYGQVVHDVVTAFERHVEMPTRDVPTYAIDARQERSAGSVAAAAQYLRKAWGLARAPIPHLLRVAEHHGVIVVYSPLQTSAVDAYSFDTGARPIVILNPLKGDYYRQRFDLAHELGHLVMHADVEPGDRAAETQANQFAAELLMPSVEILHNLEARVSWPALQALKEQWGVSMAALLYRARELEVISDVTYRNAMMRMSKEGWRRREPGPQPAAEQPSLLPHALRLLEESGAPFSALAAEARTPMRLFRTLTARTPEQTPSPNIEAREPIAESHQIQGGARIMSLLDPA